MYYDEIATTIQAITFETFRRRSPDLSFIGFVQWVREALSPPENMYCLLCRHYLALARIAHNGNAETGIKMVEIFQSEEAGASVRWDSPEVSFPLFVIVGLDSMALKLTPSSS